MTNIETTEPDAPAAPAASEAVDWRDGIADARLREFSSRFASPIEAVKTAFELRQKLSTAAVPDGPEGYALRAPEGREPAPAELAFQGEIAALLHGAEVTTRQAEILNRGWNELTEQARVAQDAADAKALSRAEHELRREWGTDYDRNRAMAERAVAWFHGGDAKEILNLELRDGRLLGSLPAFIRYAASVGERLMEDTLHSGAVTPNGVSIQERLTEVHGWQYADDPALREKYRSPAIQAELGELYRVLHGDGAVVGGEGRRT